ncbi:MAG: hypothetical protein H6Q14_1657, partial [Bacteroidetes bacterium]|nr:hypothetical protein [Bacteroidota bacterium]
MVQSFCTAPSHNQGWMKPRSGAMCITGCAAQRNFPQVGGLAEVNANSKPPRKDHVGASLQDAYNAATYFLPSDHPDGMKFGAIIRCV